MAEKESLYRDMLQGEFDALVELLSGDALARTLRFPLAQMMKRVDEPKALDVLRSMVTLGERISVKLSEAQQSISSPPMEPAALPAEVAAHVAAHPDAEHVISEETEDAALDVDPATGLYVHPAAANELGACVINGAVVFLTRAQASAIGVEWRTVPQTVASA